MELELKIDAGHLCLSSGMNAYDTMSRELVHETYLHLP